jgi:hypothetical protein
VGGGAKRGVAAGAFVAWVIASFQWVVGVTARLARARIEEGGCGLRARLEYCLRPALGQVTIGKARPLAAGGREPPPPDHPKPAAGRLALTLRPSRWPLDRAVGGLLWTVGGRQCTNPYERGAPDRHHYRRDPRALTTEAASDGRGIDELAADNACSVSHSRS